MAGPTYFELAAWTLVSLLAMTYLLARHWRDTSGVGLLIAYVLNFAVLYWLVPAIYLVPGYWNARLPLSFDGLRQSTFAIVSFVVGGEIAALVIRLRARSAGRLEIAANAEVEPERVQALMPLEAAAAAAMDPRLATVLIVVGVAMYALILPFAGLVPSLTAIASGGSMLALAGVALRCWMAWQRRDRRAVALWLASTALMPWITVLTQGFLGYGFAAMLVLFAFVASVFRPRWKYVVAGTAMVYLGLSVYVTYMRDRREIRALVWTNAEMTSRVDRVIGTVQQAEWFDPSNPDHLDRIERRLDQNALIGAAIGYLTDHPHEFAHGETVEQAVAAVIPRALWPDKPIVAGSGDLVSRFTGIRFAANTSVGIGQVLECYVNFSTIGVVAGFVGLGALVCFIDRRAWQALDRGDAVQFVVWFLPGLSLLQVGGSFVELTATAAASFVIALAFGLWAKRAVRPLTAPALGPMEAR